MPLESESAGDDDGDHRNRAFAVASEQDLEQVGLFSFGQPDPVPRTHAQRNIDDDQRQFRS